MLVKNNIVGSGGRGDFRVMKYTWKYIHYIFFELEKKGRGGCSRVMSFVKKNLAH